MTQEIYREGFEEGLQYAIDLLEELLYEYEGEDSIPYDDIKDVLSDILKTKHN